MKFTDRFIKLPIQVFDKKMAEVTGKEEGEDSWMNVNPLEIATYRPSYDKDDDDKKEIVYITLKNGDGTNIYMGFAEFEEAINNHMK